MHKRSLIIILISLLTITIQAQIYDPVTWDFGYEKKGNDQYELVFTATIEEGSHIYSTDIPEGGPIPTSFTFDTVPDFSFDGSVIRGDEAGRKI